MNINRFYLRPGEWQFSEEPAQITTILGSCVAVTLFDQASGAAAICHGILPFGESGCAEPGRYMSTAISSMLSAFSLQGIPLQALQAKVFGGAALFPKAEKLSVGALNVRVALELLERHSITVLGKNVGGVNGRKIVFHTSTGDVFLKHLGRPLPEARQHHAV